MTDTDDMWRAIRDLRQRIAELEERVVDLESPESGEPEVYTYKDGTTIPIEPPKKGGQS